MIEEIKAWVHSAQDYQEGLVLYTRYGRSKSLIRVLTIGGQNAKNQATLSYELMRMLGSAVSENIVEIAKTITNIIDDHQKAVIEQEKDDHKQAFIGRRQNTPEIDKLVREKTDLLKEWDSLHATLDLVNKETCKLNAFRILDIGDILDDMYNRLEHYNKHGELPPAKIFPKPKWDVNKPFDVARRRTTLRTYITREKKQIRDATSRSTKAVHENRLLKFQLELDHLERNLIR